jgi:glucose-1-phosphate thymidylyltransferase
MGLNFSINNDSAFNYSIIRDSIIGSYTNLYEVVLDNSLIGSDASVKGLSRNLNIGDKGIIRRLILGEGGLLIGWGDTNQ